MPDVDGAVSFVLHGNPRRVGIGHHVLDADRFAELVLNEPGPLPDDVIPPPKWERIRSWFGAGPPDDPRPSG